MENNLEEFQRLKKAVEDAERKKSRAEGALAQLTQRLDEFGCNSFDEVPAVLEKLEKEERSLEKEFHKAKKEFDEKWGSRSFLVGLQRGH